MIKTRLVLVLFLCAAWLLPASHPVMRISVENSDTHVQTQAVRAFAQEIGEKLDGIIEVEFYSGSSLFRDSEVVRALAQGKVEMAVPGIWHLGSYVPETGIFLLPAFYGGDPELVYAYTESRAGRQLVSLLEDELFVHIPGSWMDLGRTHIFTREKPIRSYADIPGLRIRVAGGYGNEARIAAMGAYPVVIPWPDVPTSLLQKQVAGLLTSYETVRSASLWEYGLSYIFEDRQYFAQYVPMISQRFWRSLPAEVQQVITDSWQQAVGPQRMAAEQAQQQAKMAALSAGMEVVRPDENEHSRMKRLLLTRQKETAAFMGIDPAHVGALTQFISEFESGSSL